jgi:hypothetical protein
MKNMILFEETQRFRQRWLWAILLFVTGMTVYQFYGLMDLNISFVDNITAHPEMFFGIILNVLLLVLFYFARLETKINQEGIYFRFFPFHLKFQSYPWKDITAKSVIRYSPLMDYGGWGIRGIGRKKAFNVSGNKGLQLVLANGNRRLIGTQKLAEMEKALDKI